MNPAALLRRKKAPSKLKLLEPAGPPAGTHGIADDDEDMLDDAEPL